MAYRPSSPAMSTSDASEVLVDPPTALHLFSRLHILHPTGLTPIARNGSSPSFLASNELDEESWLEQIVQKDRNHGNLSLGQVQELVDRYVTLKQYLNAPPLASNDSSRAQHKLIALSWTQFGELSQDVYDDVLRRQANVPEVLGTVRSFHAKRNDARRKLGGLPLVNFRRLVSDVVLEMELRFPRFPQMYDSVHPTWDENTLHPQRDSSATEEPRSHQSGTDDGQEPLQPSNVPFRTASQASSLAFRGKTYSSLEARSSIATFRTAQSHRSSINTFRTARSSVTSVVDTYTKEGYENPYGSVFPPGQPL